MDPKHHVLLGFIFSIIIFLIFPSIGILGFLLIFLSSFLVDVDHYLYYVYKNRKLSLRKAYMWHIRKRKKWYVLSRKKRNKS